MSTKVLCVLAVYAVAVESAKHANSAQYILKHDDHHHLVHVHPPVHAHYHKPHQDYYVSKNPKYDKYEVKPKHTGPYRPPQGFLHGDVRDYYSLDEPDGTIRHVQILAEKHVGLNADVKHGAHHPHHIHHYHHHHHHHHHKRDSS